MAKSEKIFGTKQKPRISVFRSNHYITAQAIDDEAGVTLLAVSSKKIEGKMPPLKKAFEAGKTLGAAIKAKKITEAVYDRANYRYHGQVKALADGIREAGIKF